MDSTGPQPAGGGKSGSGKREDRPCPASGRPHTDRIRALTFSPDGSKLVTGSWDNTVKLWDVVNGALLWSDWQTSSIPSVAFNQDGSLLALSGEKVAQILLWDL